MRSLFIALAVGALTACYDPAPVASLNTAATAASVPSASNSSTIPTRFVDFGQEQHNALWDKAMNQIKGGKIAAPASDNAVETYLALRAALPAGSERLTDVNQALKDLLPYVLLQSDVALAENDMTDATRLTRIVAAIDRNAPALPRLVATIKERTGAVPPAPVAPPVQ